MAHSIFNYHSEEQSKEQEEADKRGYEEGEEMRREQERERWLAGLEEVVEDVNRRKCWYFI